MRARLLVLWAVALSVVLAPLALVPTRAYACSCVYDPGDQRLIERAEVIFSGELVSNRTSALSSLRELTFAVSRVYKGQALAEQVVVTADNSAACGLEIPGDGPYVIFARGAGGDVPGLAVDELQSGLCDGSRAGPAPASLGPGSPPTPRPAAAPAWESGLGRGGIGALLVLGAASAAFFIRRRRGRKSRVEGGA
ncbi:MAG: hypothetical protein ABWY56_17115 [Propionibacteriaceae bacterium]